MTCCPARRASLLGWRPTFLARGPCLLPAALLGVRLGAQTVVPQPGAPDDRRAPALATVSIEDAIGMTRVQQTGESDGRTMVFAPDGSVAATVVWRGDLTRDCNVYSLLVFDLRAVQQQQRAAPISVLSVDFSGDSVTQDATPIAQLQILADNRTITFLGTLHGEPRQVYAVDRVTHQVTALTHHGTAVRSYGIGPDGQVRVFSAVAPVDTVALRLRNRSGYALLTAGDPSGFGALRRVNWDWAQQTRQYFVVPLDTPVLVFDTKESVRETHADTVWQRDPKRRKVITITGSPADDRMPKTLSIDPTGRYALFWPYTTRAQPARPERYTYFADKNPFENRFAAPYGLIDLHTGRVTRLIDAPHAPYTGVPIWSPDGRSVIINSLLPLDATNPRVVRARAQGVPELIEVELATGRIVQLHVPDQWTPMCWVQQAGQQVLFLLRGQTVASASRSHDRWGALTELGPIVGLNPRYGFTTNGEVVAGVKDSLATAPDIAVYNLRTRQMTVLTDLNPELRKRQFAPVEKVYWRGPYDSASFGYLVMPVNYQPGRRYPLLVLLKDDAYDDNDNSFLIDGQAQLSGFAIQSFAADGFVILFTPFPPSVQPAIQAPTEGEHMRAHVESGVAYLKARGLIDTTRIAISGWSRASYYTSYILGHSRFPFAAATQIDGGVLFDNINRGGYIPVEQYQTPVLLEVHNPYSVAYNWPYIERLHMVHKPIEVYYYPASPHNIRQRVARWESLKRHEAWYRYWLQDWCDTDPTKRAQYARWDAMRQMLMTAGRSASVSRAEVCR